MRKKWFISIFLILMYLFLMNSCWLKKVVPAGILGVYVSTGHGLTSASYAVISFDSDNDFGNGSAYNVRIPLAGELVGDTIDHVYNWHAEDLEPGTYYVYAWKDVNGNNVLDPGNPETQNLTGAFVVSIYLDGEIGYSNTGTQWTIDAADVYPNYTFWEDSAAPINLSLN